MLIAGEEDATVEITPEGVLVSRESEEVEDESGAEFPQLELSKLTTLGLMDRGP